MNGMHKWNTKDSQWEKAKIPFEIYPVKQDIQVALNDEDFDADLLEIKAKSAKIRLTKVVSPRLRRTAKTFAYKGIIKYKAKYDYSESKYKSSKHVLRIKCNACQKYFSSTPEQHLLLRKECNCTTKTT